MHLQQRSSTLLCSDVRLPEQDANRFVGFSGITFDLVEFARITYLGFFLFNVKQISNST